MNSTYQKSQALFEKAKKLAPGGVHSPVRAFKAVGGTPLFMKKGEGAHIWDADGNEYVDFCMSWGALSVGHAHPKVVEAVQKQAQLGTHYGTPTELDVELAELALSALKPFDRIRFVSSGTEAVMTAVRLARGVTGRDKLVKVDGSYHGHLDSLLVNAGSGLVTQGQSSSAGVTKAMVEDTLVVPCNSIEALHEVFRKHGNEIAAIILEPIMANNGLFEFAPGYLEACREITKKHKSLLIFDEVITGFRVAWGGAKAFYKAEPDIGTYGKILGGGLPVGAIAAKSEILSQLAPEGTIYQAGTLSGNPIAMTAGISTLTAMKEMNYYEKVNSLGQYLDKKIEEIKDKDFFYRRIEGIFWVGPGQSNAPKDPTEIGSNIKDAFRERYHGYLKNGVYLSPSVFEVGFLSSAHTTEDLDKLVRAVSQK